jgi:hypothetical protein
MPVIENTIFLHDCDPEELSENIRKLDNSKASDIPIRVVKKSAHIISPILSKSYNILMKSGVFPGILKIGKITPVYKKGNPEDLGNYRPVSTLPIFGKIFEKVIYSRLYSFALSQNIIIMKTNLALENLTGLVMPLTIRHQSFKIVLVGNAMSLEYSLT